jgi:Ca-activated chloride channel family protein
MNSTNPHDGFGCDSFAEELSLFVFGELDDARRASLESHLVGCAACRGERDALVRSLELLKQEGGASGGGAAPQLSPARQANLLAQAQAIAPPPRPRLLRLGRLAAAAAVVATAGIAAWAVMERDYSAEHFRRATPNDSVAFVRDRAAPITREELEGSDRDLGLATNASKPAPDPAAAESSADAGRSEVLHAPAPQLKNLAGGASSPAQEAQATKLADLARSTGDCDEDAAKAVPAAASPEVESSPAATGGTAAGRVSSGTPSPLAGRRMGLGLAKGQAKPAAPAAPPAPRDGTRARRGEGNSKDAPPTPEIAGNPLTSIGGSSAVDSYELDGFATAAAPSPNSPSLDAESIEALRRIGYAVDQAAPTPDIAGNDFSDYHTTLEWANGESCLYVGVDGNAAGPAASKIAVSPAMLGQLLAIADSPSQLLRIQRCCVAALGVDPAQPARPNFEADRDTLIREFLDRLSRRQSEPPRDMFFRYFGDHPFVATCIDPKSTFGMDVDTASYALVRSYLSRGTLPPKAAVRTEEFVNAFRHDLAPPAGRDVFAVHTELAPSPFGEEGQVLLQIGVKAREIPKSERKPVALTLVIDVSGSMEQDGRLELVKRGLHLLVDQLGERDSVGIVCFESTGRRVLDPVDASQRSRIYAALDALRPGGSTNVDQGLRLGYEMALAQLRPNAENRVVLCSDGVANTGVTDAKWLSARIAECKSKYVYLNCVGVGMGNHNDALMEQLADEGDGFCAYIDRVEEAKKLFVDRLTGTLLTVARNAKIQVEFDPAGVRRFRQLGYENRALAHRDFRNDKVVAGAVGAGQEVVALYEVELARDALHDAKVPLAAVRVRYEDPDVGQVREQERQVVLSDLRTKLAQTTPRFRLSACVAEFAEILRQSVHARDGSLGAVERLAEPLIDELRGDPDVPEFVALVKQAARLPDLIPARTGFARAVDEVKRFRCVREELREEGATDDQLRQLEEQNRRLEQALRDALDRALRHS